MTRFSRTTIECTRSKTRVLSITPNWGTDERQRRAQSRSLSLIFSPGSPFLPPLYSSPHFNNHCYHINEPTSTTASKCPITTDNHQTRYQTTWVAHHPKNPLPGSRNVQYSMVATPAFRVSATSQILSQRPRRPRAPLTTAHGAQVKQLDRMKLLRPTPVVVSLDNLRCSLKRRRRSARNSFRKRRGWEAMRSIPASDVGVR